MPVVMQNGNRNTSGQGMFATHSPVSQLKADTVVQCVQKAEENQYGSGDVLLPSVVAGAAFTTSSGSSAAQANSNNNATPSPSGSLHSTGGGVLGEGEDLGTVLLGCGYCVKDIHGYFSQLESRTCRVSIGVRRTQNSIRPVPESINCDDGSAKTSRRQTEVLYLDQKELRVFKHAFLCAVYPVLAAPSPPSPASPVQVHHTSTNPRRHSSATSTGTQSSRAQHDKESPFRTKAGTIGAGGVQPYGQTSSSSATTSDYEDSSKSYHRSGVMSPYGFHDSGVEEIDETNQIGLIPMESLRLLLQRAFGLTETLFRQYESAVVREYAKTKRSSQKLLAEELTGQLAVLENDDHPFYKPGHFPSGDGYTLWKEQEWTRIKVLLGKFWQQNLPNLRDNREHIEDLQTVHKDYETLLKKLLSHESKFREDEGGSRITTFTPLSSASCRLLLEFGLRYGVGEMYRKTLLLQHLIEEFSSSVGYLSYVNSLVLSIKRKDLAVMVKQEQNLLHSSLRFLKTQACKSLNQMKGLFPDREHMGGIDILLALLKSVMGLMAHLSPPSSPRESYSECVTNTIQGIFEPHYERIKAVVRADCSQSRGADITPQMLNIVVGDIRAEVAHFRNNFEATFQRFFSITKMAATSFYKLLMRDVDIICKTSEGNKAVGINRQTLALAYRLNQLDSEWAAYILPRQRTWRLYFLPILDEWNKVLRQTLQQFVIKTVSSDAFESLRVDLPQPLPTYQVPSLISERRSCSISLVSITPSVNSAFSSIMSSIRSTPCHAASAQPKFAPDNGAKVSRSSSRKIPVSRWLDRSPKGNSASVEIIHEADPVTFSCKSLDSNLPTIPAAIKTRESNLPNFMSMSLPEKLNKMFTGSDKVPSGRSSVTHQDCAVFEPVPQQPQSLEDKGSNSVSGKSLERQSSVASDTLGSEHLFSPLKIPAEGIITPSLSSEGDGRRGSGSTINHGQFSFPPITVDTPASISEDVTDFSQPVFQQPLSQSVESNGYEYRDRLGPGLSPSALLSGEVNSTVTVTDTRDAVLAISGSAIDVIVLLQRLCGFATNILSVILMGDIFSTEGNWDMLVSTKRLKMEASLSSVVREREGSDSSDSSGPMSGKSNRRSSKTVPIPPNYVPGAQMFPSWTTLSSKFSSNISSARTADEAAEGRRASFQSSLDKTDSQASSSSDHSGYTRERSRLSESVKMHPHPEEEYFDENVLFTPMMHFRELQTKLRLHLQVIGTLCNTVVVYSTNMLCMDLCGTPKSVAKKLVGSKLVNHVRQHQASGAVWGCRHQAEVPYGCLHYYNRRVDFLCERYEPVTHNMCTRVNNTFACMHVLKEYKSKLIQIFGLERKSQEFNAMEKELLKQEEDMLLLHKGGRLNKELTGSEEFDLWDVTLSSTYSAVIVEPASNGNTYTGAGGMTNGHGNEEAYVSSEEDSLLDVIPSAPFSLHQRWQTQAQRSIAAAECHLLATVNGMCRLLAYKLNLFVRDGIPMLLRLRDSEVSMEACLAPIITFMQRYLDSLSSWLYQDCFKRVLNCLWVLMVQDIEYQADLLLKAESSAKNQAKDWMLAIGVLIKFMNNNKKGIRKELLLSQANSVIFHFQLFTFTTEQLIILYEKLKDYHTEVDFITLEENTSRIPPAIVHRIHADLQSLRKCFSGTELVRWIVKNREVLPADLSIQGEKITKEMAIVIAQSLLDNHFIQEVESLFRTTTNTPISAMDHMDPLSPYPQLSIHSRMASEADDSWESGTGRHQRPRRRNSSDHRRGRHVSVSSEDLSDDAAAVNGHSAMFEAPIEVHSDFPQLTSKHSPGSITPTANSGVGFLNQHRGASAGGEDLVPASPFSDQQSSAADTSFVTPSGRDSSTDSSTPTTTPVGQDNRNNTDKDTMESGISRTESKDDGNSNRKSRPVQKESHRTNHSKKAEKTNNGSTMPKHENDRRDTASPFSSIADLTYANTSSFIASSRRFYFIHQSVLNPGLSFGRHRPQEDMNQSGSSYLKHISPSRKQAKQHKSESETADGDGRSVRGRSSGRLSAPIFNSSTATSGGSSTPFSPSSVGPRWKRRGSHFEGFGARDDKLAYYHKNSMENLALVEQCITHKVSPDRIVAIITGRKKVDNLAKQFAKLIS